MVSFETEIYNRQADDVIGIKVMVIADNGQTIESIHCINDTDFNELKAKLDVLNEEFVQFDENSSLQGETIDAILANAAEVVNINATSLGGFQSDEFSKTGHTHLKQSITDLYDYDISLSEYNVGIGDSITVTVSVTNMSGSPVNNHSVIVYKDGAVWKTGRTNNNGIFSSSYTVDSTGLITFSVKNQKCVCNAESEWETITTTTYSLKVNKTLRLVKYSGDANVTFSNTNREVHLDDIPSEYSPSSHVRQVCHNNLSKLSIIAVTPAGSVSTISYTAHTDMISWEVLWAY